MSKMPNRASPLPPDERKAAIIEAVIPAMIEHGAALTSRQIAEAAGVAEGTVFRAFGDKETLLREAADAYLDPAPIRAALGRIDSTLPLEDKVAEVLRILQDRFHGVINIMAAIGHHGGPPPQLRDRMKRRPQEYVTIVAKLVEPELELLNVPVERIAPYIRLLAFATAIPQFNHDATFELRELARLVVYGIAGDTRPGDEDAARRRAARVLGGDAQAPASDGYGATGEASAGDDERSGVGRSVSTRV